MKSLFRSVTEPFSLAAACLLFVVLPVALPVLAADDPGSAREVLAAVSINGRIVSDASRLVQSRGVWYATADDFKAWRLKLPQQPPVMVSGRTYYLLAASHIRCSMDFERQLLSLSIPTAEFLPQVLDAQSEKPPQPSGTQPGIFVNHNLELDVAHGVRPSGLFELGAFSKFGVLTSRFAGSDLSSSAPIRLDTQLVKDFPERMSTLTVGDAVSSYGMWARQVNYAGVRWSRNFGTQPTFVPLAMPTFAGQAVAPSTVDIYVNSVRTFHQNVDTGPFAINNVPVITGTGDVQMVVTDMLGHQQIVSQPYITSRQVLRKGVSEFTYEAGVLHYGIGQNNGAYHSGFVDGTHRLAITDATTIDIRGEVTADVQAIGAGADLAVLPMGVISAGVAGSHAEGQDWGGLAYAQISRSGRSWGYAAMVQARNHSFRQLGLLATDVQPKTTTQAQIHVALTRRTSLSASYLRQASYHRPPGTAKSSTSYDFTIVSTALSVPVTRSAFVTFAANYAPALSPNPGATLSLVIPLGGRKIFSADAQLQGGKAVSTAEFDQQLPTGTGYGYRVRTTAGETQRVDAGLAYQNESGTYQAEMSQAGGQSSWRFSEMGSVVLLQREVATSRWLNDSFAVVKIPHEPHVDVFSNHQLVAKTNARGLAVVPNLIAYDRNSLQIDDRDVPLDIGVDLEQKTIVPRYRSGTFVLFDAARVQGALLVLTTEDGMPVPLNATVRVERMAGTYSVALHGEVFVPEISFPARLDVRWDGNRCIATVPQPRSARALPRLGPITCWKPLSARRTP